MTTIYVLIESKMSAIGVLFMYLSPLSMCVHDICMQGRPHDLGGEGGKNFFFQIFFFRFGEAMRIARGVRGHAPPRKFFKTVQFGEF